MRIRKLGFYVPFTFHFLIFACALALAFNYLDVLSDEPESSYRDVSRLLLLVAVAFSSLFLVLGFVSVLLAYVFIKWKQSSGLLTFTVNTRRQSGNVQEVGIQLVPVLRPLLGFIKLRLQYDEDDFSRKFAVAVPGGRNIFSTKLDGVYYWDLPGIREYRVSGAMIYFEDFFQFFSLAVHISSNAAFYRWPETTKEKDLRAAPRKTDEVTTRIDEMRKVEGELINYKNFESNDDVRRIVWKIYARNKELVVRIPEILDPYASHLYLFASFHTVIEPALSPVIGSLLLDFYKTQVWSCYRELSDKGFDVRYKSDQPPPSRFFDKAGDQVQFQVTSSTWQVDHLLHEAVSPRDISMVIISSLNDPDDVKRMLDLYDLAFVFVPLSECIRSSAASGVLRWLFTIEDEREEVLRRKWLFSPVRARVLQNENRLKEIFKNYSKVKVVEA